VVYVALDENGRPRPVPPLIAETEFEARRLGSGRERQAYRLAQREAERQEAGS
jgi:acyl-CoA hydrolase